MRLLGAGGEFFRRGLGSSGIHPVEHSISRSAGLHGSRKCPSMSERAASCALFGQSRYLQLLASRMPLFAVRSFQARPDVIARDAHSPVA